MAKGRRPSLLYYAHNLPLPLNRVHASRKETLGHTVMWRKISPSSVWNWKQLQFHVHFLYIPYPRVHLSLSPLCDWYRYGDSDILCSQSELYFILNSDLKIMLSCQVQLMQVKVSGCTQSKIPGLENQVSEMIKNHGYFQYFHICLEFQTFH